MVGTTGSGKSQLSRALFLTVPAPRLVIDPSDSTLTTIPGAVTFSDPARPTNAAGENWRIAATARFVPTDPDDRDAYGALYAWCWAHFPRYVWVDEASFVFPSRGAAKQARRLLIAGRKRQLGHLACHTRPREIDRNLIALASHVFIFELPNPDDVAHVAQMAGIPAALLEAELARLPHHGFLWWNARARTLTACPPLKVR